MKAKRFASSSAPRRATWTKELKNREVVLLAQMATKAHVDLPKVPLAVSFAKNDEARKLIVAVAQSHGAAVRPYLLPPGRPTNLVEILRKGFIEAIRDPELLTEANRARLEINAASGEELERNVKELFHLDSSLVARLKDILK